MKSVIQRFLCSLFIFGISYSTTCVSGDRPNESQIQVPGGYGQNGIERFPHHSSSSFSQVPPYTASGYGGGSGSTVAFVMPYTPGMVQYILPGVNQPQNQYSNSPAGGYYQGVPVYNGQHRATAGVEQPQQLVVSQVQVPVLNTSLLVSSRHYYVNSSGIVRDVSADFSNATYLSGSFLRTLPESFSRKTNNSSLFVIRIGNTYDRVCEESNDNSTVVELSAFNRFKGGKTVNNKNTSRFCLSIGDDVFTPKEFDSGSDSNSTNVSFSVSRKVLAALITATFAWKCGAVHAALTAVGMGAQVFVVVPVMIGGAILFPVIMSVGGVLLCVGFTTATALAGIGVSLTAMSAPIVLPVLLFALLFRS